MKEFLHGMVYLFLGVRHLLTKGLKRFILLPIAFNFLLFSGLFYLVYHYLFPYSTYYVDKLPTWLSFLNGIFFVLLIIGFFLCFLSVFTIFFNMIAAPFNGLLAEKAQRLLYGTQIPSLTFAQIAVRSIKRQGQFMGYFISRFIIVCLLFFVPFIHPIYPIIWFFFNAWMLSMQYQDFVMDNNLIDFPSMKKIMNDKKMLTLGLGTSINLISFIPILNIFIMPAAVIGSVILFRDHIIAHKSDSTSCGLSAGSRRSML